MPRVLHVIPRDATLTGFGLEAWVDQTRGFLPVLAAVPPTGWAERGDRWDLHPVTALPPVRSGMARMAARLTPGAGPWTRLLVDQRIDLVHLHDPAPALDALEAAERLGLPVVATMPGHGAPGLPFERLAQVLAPSAARADEARQQGALVRLSPPPIPAPAAPRRYRPDPRPLRWVTAVTDAEREHLGLVVRTFVTAMGEADQELVVLLAGPWLAEAQAIVDAYAPGAPVKLLHVADAEGLRAAIATADAAFFPLAHARPQRGEGLTWPAWVAASLGLPMVLARGPALLDGFTDQHTALLADEHLVGLAARMKFLASRPHAWPTLGAAAQRYAVGRLAYDRACEIPAEVYRQVLQEQGARSVS